MKQICALALLASVAVPSPSCVADVSDEPVGAAVERGLHRGAGGTSPAQQSMTVWLAHHQGPCAQACLTALAQGCPWQQVCADDTDFVECGGLTLTCAEAESAGSSAENDGLLVGLSTCWGRCEASH